jgi:hypothetical protein
VLLDAMLPGYSRVYGALPAPDRQMALDRAGANPERVNLAATLSEAQVLAADIPRNLPITYLATRDLAFPATWPAQKLKPIVREEQRAFVKQFPRGRLLLVDSPHHMEPAVPELIAEEIHRIVRANGE